MRSLLLLVPVLVLALAACTPRDSSRWDDPAVQPAAAAVGKPAKRIVLFAPASVGPLAAIHPQARLDFPYRCAVQIDRQVETCVGRVSEVLPASDSPQWSRGRIAATAGAHLVVLTSITDLDAVRGSVGLAGRDQRVVATARVCGLDAAGRQVFLKTATAALDVSSSPKLMSPESRPESRAAYDALEKCLASLRAYLEHEPDAAQRPVDGALVEVLIGSSPTGADIFIDGVLRGTTPHKLLLPVREMTLRLERQNCQPWEHTLTPAADMHLQPALEPVGAAPGTPTVPNASPAAPTPGDDEPAAG